jgi:hypothetical protein
MANPSSPIDRDAIARTLEEAKDFTHPNFGYRWASNSDRWFALPLIKELTEALEALTRNDEV